jgi:hypothetical protein
LLDGIVRGPREGADDLGVANAGVTVMCWVICVRLQSESALSFCLLKVLFRHSPFLMTVGNARSQFVHFSYAVPRKESEGGMSRSRTLLE